MLRFIRTLAALLALGAATSIALALGAACLPAPAYFRGGGCTGDPNWKPTPIEWLTMRLHAPTGMRQERIVGRTAIWSVSFGWPAQCMRYEAQCSLDDEEDKMHLVHGIVLPIRSIRPIAWWDDGLLVLPSGINPIPFAIDTAAFTLAWSAPVLLPRAKRALRLRRGLCPHCAYSLAGLAPNSPCPECGHAHA